MQCVDLGGRRIIKKKIFFKQKTAYEMLRSLVGSEMCIRDRRGIVTIWIAHTTFCAAYVAVVVSARLRELDLSIEEAAMDLGAKPFKVFFLITIPMIAPSLAAGGMMSFALSLDDLVLASFVSGPGSTTLPLSLIHI